MTTQQVTREMHAIHMDESIERHEEVIERIEDLMSHYGLEFEDEETAFGKDYEGRMSVRDYFFENLNSYAADDYQYFKYELVGRLINMASLRKYRPAMAKAA